MIYKKSDTIEDLLLSVTQELVPLIPGIETSIDTIGTHSYGRYVRGDRICKVRCLDLAITQYLVSFDLGDYMEAWGKTYQKEEAISAMGKWLQGEELLQLYEQYDFINREKRLLSVIELQVLAHHRELTRSTGRSLYNHSNFTCELHINTEHRSCLIHYDSENQIPDFEFYCDQKICYRVQTKQIEQGAEVIKRLLADQADPADIAKEFPWSDEWRPATYNENDRGVAGDFLVSWDLIEEFYYDFLEHWPVFHTQEVLDFIAQLRERGYDRTLRAGQSLTSLILSRSRWHGLREDQPWVSFDFGKDYLSVNTKINKDDSLIFPSIEFRPRIFGRLMRLKEHEID